MDHALDDTIHRVETFETDGEVDVTASEIFAFRASQLATPAQGGIFIQWLDSFPFPLGHICFIVGRKSFGHVSIADFL